MRNLVKAALIAFVVLLFLRFGKTGSVVGEKLDLPLDVQAISGTPVAAGKPTIVEFWATWCPPCRKTIPHLNEVYAKYAPRGLQIVGLTDEDAATVRTFQQAVPMHYPVAQDKTQRYFKQFNIRGIPSMVLIDASGRVLWKGYPWEFEADKELPKLLGTSS